MQCRKTKSVLNALICQADMGIMILEEIHLKKVYADCFKGEDALVRPQITCGTHALALALMSNLRPGDELLSPVGKPYDTLEEVIGIRPSKVHSLNMVLHIRRLIFCLTENLILRV